MAGVACTGCIRPTASPPLMKHLGVQIVLLASASKSSPAPPSTTRARSPPSRGTRTHARGPPLSSSGSLRADEAVWPFVSLAFLDRDRYGLRVLLFALYRSAPPAFIFCRACRARPLSSAAPGRLPHSSACCSGRISSPRLAKVGGADGALREDHLVCGQTARQPYDAKACKTSS